MEPTRRELLVGVASVIVGGCRDVADSDADDASSGPSACGVDDEQPVVEPGPWEHACAPIDGGPIDEVIAWLAAASRDELFDGAVDRLAAGLTIDQLVAGMYISQVTLAYANDEHTRLVIPSAQRAGGYGTSHHEALPLLWCLRRNHPAAMGSSVCPAPAVAADASAAAIDRLRAALDAWDEPAADAALVAALRGGQLGATRDVMLEYGARTHDWIGHTMIEASQAARAIAAAGNRGAEPIFRALLRSMMRGAAKTTAPFDANRERLSTLPDDWQVGEPDEGATLELLAELRTADDETAAAAAAQMLADGVGARAIWDATRLGAAELTLRFPWPVWIKFPLHAVTSNNALRIAHDATCDDRLRRLLTLQAVAWLPVHREQARAYQAAEPLPGWEIDTLEPIGDPSATIEALIEAADVNRRDGVAQALGWLGAGGDAAALRRGVLEHCVAYTFEEHEIKFPIAALEEAEAASEGFRDRLLAAALAYGASTTNGRWAEQDAAVAALERLH